MLAFVCSNERIFTIINVEKLTNTLHRLSIIAAEILREIVEVRSDAIFTNRDKSVVAFVQRRGALVKIRRLCRIEFSATCASICCSGRVFFLEAEFCFRVNLRPLRHRRLQGRWLFLRHRCSCHLTPPCSLTCCLLPDKTSPS